MNRFFASSLCRMYLEVVLTINSRHFPNPVHQCTPCILMSLHIMAGCTAKHDVKTAQCTSAVAIFVPKNLWLAFHVISWMHRSNHSHIICPLSRWKGALGMMSCLWKHGKSLSLAWLPNIDVTKKQTRCTLAERFRVFISHWSPQESLLTVTANLWGFSPNPKQRPSAQELWNQCEGDVEYRKH